MTYRTNARPKDSPAPRTPRYRILWAQLTRGVLGRLLLRNYRRTRCKDGSHALIRSIYGADANTEYALEFDLDIFYCRQCNAILADCRPNSFWCPRRVGASTWFADRD